MMRSRVWCCVRSSCASAKPQFANWSSRHTSAFTRAVPPRGLTMRLPRSPVHPRDIGRGTKPCHVSNDCLAAAGKARLRAPFGGLSRATPVPLRHLIPRERGRLFSRHAHDVPRSPSLAARGRRTITPGWYQNASSASQACPPLFQDGGEPFSARALAWSFASSPHTSNTGPASTHRHALQPWRDGSDSLMVSGDGEK